jgi:hypothetical protein
MNLVNNGKFEEKCAHSFKFFDIKKKGIIEKDDFKLVILALCQFFSSVSSSQSRYFLTIGKLREDDIDIIFDDIIDKNDNKPLDMNSFIKISADFPELLDFFDIFNNKLMRDMTIVISRDHIRRLDLIIGNIKKLIEKTNNKNDMNRITISLKNWVDRALRNKNINNNLLHLNTASGKMYGISKKVTEYNESEDSHGELSMLSESNISQSEMRESEIIHSSEKRLDTKHSLTLDTFEFIQPVIIKNEEYLRELAEQGIDLNDCLIISKKKAFLNYLNDLRDELSTLVKE